MTQEPQTPRRMYRMAEQPSQWDVQNHINKWNGCKLCPLGCQPELANYVFYRGHVPAEVVFIGEAPGSSENGTGFPFANPSAAGGVFDTILEGILQQFPKLTWSVTNSVLCFPVNRNPQKKGDFRTPTNEEIKACSPRLMEFLRLCEPRLIVVMGQVAEKAINMITMGFGVYEKSNPRIIKIPHPSWMQRDEGRVDTELEIKRAVLNVTGVIRSLKGNQ